MKTNGMDVNLLIRICFILKILLFMYEIESE